MRPEDQLRSETIKPVASATETVRDEDKIMLVLAYLGIFALIPMLTVKDSEFVKWHAKQGLVLGVGGGVALAIIGAVLSFVLIGPCVAAVGYVGIFVLCIMGMVKALAGQRWRIPVVADLADKL